MHLQHFRAAVWESDDVWPIIVMGSVRGRFEQGIERHLEAIFHAKTEFEQVVTEYPQVHGIIRDTRIIVAVTNREKRDSPCNHTDLKISLTELRLWLKQRNIHRVAIPNSRGHANMAMDSLLPILTLAFAHTPILIGVFTPPSILRQLTGAGRTPSPPKHVAFNVEPDSNSDETPKGTLTDPHPWDSSPWYRRIWACCRASTPRHDPSPNPARDSEVDE